jgi:hypothetical protein
MATSMVCSCAGASGVMLRTFFAGLHPMHKHAHATVQAILTEILKAAMQRLPFCKPIREPLSWGARQGGGDLQTLL